MRSLLRIMLVVAALSIIVIGAGCGSDEASTPDASGSASATSAAFVKQANAACQKAREGSLERVAAYHQKQRVEGVPKTVASENEAIKAALLGTITAEIKAVRALGVPSDKGEIKALLAAEQATAEDVKKRVDKLSPVQVRESFAEADKELRAQGLTGCMKTETA